LCTVQDELQEVLQQSQEELRTMVTAEQQEDQALLCKAAGSTTTCQQADLPNTAATDHHYVGCQGQQRLLKPVLEEHCACACQPSMNQLTAWLSDVKGTKADTVTTERAQLLSIWQSLSCRWAKACMLRS
jgi:hypothetical protein